MFSYYGTKKKIARYYPKPKYEKIIEPFAGAGMYSLYGDNWKKDVIINDKYEKVYRAWNFLINYASIDDIKKLPDLTTGLRIDDLNISDEEKILLGFYANPASAVPKKTVSKRGEISWNCHKRFLIDNLYKIKHWVVTNKDYNDLDNIEATWFVDPPYLFGGKYYHSSVSNNHMDYNKLSDWCLNRKGEIIVCENDKANWLPFVPLVELNGQLHKTTEVIFYKENG